MRSAPGASARLSDVQTLEHVCVPVLRVAAVDNAIVAGRGSAASVVAVGSRGSRATVTAASVFGCVGCALDGSDGPSSVPSELACWGPARGSVCSELVPEFRRAAKSSSQASVGTNCRSPSASALGNGLGAIDGGWAHPAAQPIVVGACVEGCGGISPWSWSVRGRAHGCACAWLAGADARRSPRPAVSCAKPLRGGASRAVGRSPRCAHGGAGQRSAGGSSSWLWCPVKGGGGDG